MNPSTFLLLGSLVALELSGAPASAPAASSLDDSEVRISYAELKRLLAAAQPPATPEVKAAPTIPAALLSAEYQFDGKSARLRGTFRVANFDGAWHAVPLTHAGGGAVTVEPADAPVLVADGCLCVITEKTGITSVALDFPLPLEDSVSALVTAPSALASIQGVNLPEDKVLRVHSEAGTVDVVAGVAAALPSAGGEISLSIESPADPKSPVRDAVSDAALISKATYDTEVARDGAALTEGVITVQHGSPVRLGLQLPDGAEFLQCRVNGEAVSVGVKASGLLEIPLDDPATDGAESEIRLSYTLALRALEISEGEVTLALPQTPWFVRQTDWNLRFPAGFDLAAVGNLDAIPASEAGATAGLHLRKLFARNQRAESRITYRKH